jgi:hypothetical protein
MREHSTTFAFVSPCVCDGPDPTCAEEREERGEECYPAARCCAVGSQCANTGDPPWAKAGTFLYR